MYIAGGLVETYALEMLKYAKDQRMTKQNLMNAKVIVTLVYKIGNENLEKNITGKNQNLLTDENVDKIVTTYRNRETIDKFSYVASLDEIKGNDYNLNIPRYVDTFEEEEPIDLDLVQRRISDIDKEIANVESEINDYLKKLGVLKHD